MSLVVRASVLENVSLRRLFPPGRISSFLAFTRGEYTGQTSQLSVRYHGGSVGHAGLTEVREADNVRPEEVMGNGRALLGRTTRSSLALRR